ncbi:hypothetical protein UPYG_G00067460 [Umbra pygmaea]|uniref:Uncharacterized protein n=1 Tax=Umbra pygmaea TaxID=75934 RepID=A0ABD0XB13_UMBPY
MDSLLNDTILHNHTSGKVILHCPKVISFGLRHHHPARMRVRFKPGCVESTGPAHHMCFWFARCQKSITERENDRKRETERQRGRENATTEKDNNQSIQLKFCEEMTNLYQTYHLIEVK